MTYFAKTNPGRVYPHNEDYYLLPEGEDRNEPTTTVITRKGHLFILCDGMGGANAGEVCSQMAARWLFHEYYHSTGISFPKLVKTVNDSIYNLALKYEQYKGMGTTLVAAVVNKRTARFYSVGDSRAYLLRRGELKQLTEDQSEVWKLYRSGHIAKDDIRTHPRRNVITHALGVDPDFQADDINYVECRIKKSDLFLLCCDGLTDMIPDSQVCSILSENTSLSKVASELVEAANAAGGKDNITVIMIEA